MALSRPERKGRLVTQDRPEVLLEEQLLREIQGQIRDLRTILMGAGDNGETPYGRLPMVEAKLETLSKEVSELKNSRIAAAAYWNSTRIVGHVFTAIGGGAAVVVAEKICSFFLSR